MMRVCARRADGTADNKAAVESFACADPNVDSLSHAGYIRGALCLDESADTKPTPVAA